jgi:hypothetical protein
MQHGKRQQPMKTPGIFAWLGAFAIVLLQLQLASHFDIDHAANPDVGDVCEICLKLDASGKVPETGQPFAAAPREHSVPGTVTTAPAPERRAAQHSARAPPAA